MERLLFMNQVVIVSKDLTILKMKKSKNLHVQLLMQQGRLLFVVISIDFMSITLILRDHSGMKYVVSKLRTTIQLPLVLGRLMDLKLEWGLFVDQ